MESITTPPWWPHHLLRPYPSPFSAIMALLFIPLLIPLTEAAMINAPAKSDSFIPSDNYLIDCGSATSTTMSGKLVFMSDSDSEKYMAYDGRGIVVNSSEEEARDVPSQIYTSARVFESDATYAFHVSRPGWHWVRLHFFAVPNDDRDLNLSKFQVTTDNNLVLVKDGIRNSSTWSLHEYLLNVTTERFSIVFKPSQGSMAFINGIEFVSAPDILLGDVATSVFPKEDCAGLSKVAYQTVYRLNVGGPALTAQNDTLGRTWVSDKAFLDPKVTGSDVSVKPSVITYPDGESPLIAPPNVYATATQMADAQVEVPSFNITWRLSIDTSFQYLVRLHFADIVSKSPNDLYFNLYINGKSGITGLDLTTVAGGLSSAYYSDFIVNSSMFSQPLDPLTIQVGPLLNENAGTKNALLNGLEVMRMNNSEGSLDGDFREDANGDGGIGTTPINRGTVAAVGFAMMFGAFIGLGAMAVKWKKRPQDWSKQKSFSPWLLPIHASAAGDKSFLSSSYGSRKSQFFSSTTGLGRYISLAELKDATSNWDADKIIGVGGFGNVYIGEIDDGTHVAIKRGNPSSEQGIHEFHTEIQMLSKLRHRHLVSLVGYCDENSEMILVYEYMANGPLRDHLYGSGGKKSMPHLTWKQRLEICIGAARGLHYLHTGAVHGIIHRDVKTTNILLDENFVAKMADFGLSKDAPGGADGGQTHVSTAVKGSFGYLDPEYFRKQQLTDKSDVYSFGVVLLEALCARPPIDLAAPREQVNLAEWAMQWKRKGLLDKIIDPTLVGHVSPDSMEKLAEAAEKCLSEYGVDRPTMGDVLWNLEHALQLQEAWLSSGNDEKEKDDGVVVVRSEDEDRTVPAGEGGSDAADVVDQHSGTVMFAQFAALNGR